MTLGALVKIPVTVLIAMRMTEVGVETFSLILLQVKVIEMVIQWCYISGLADTHLLL
jgi:hypothetical protein